MSKYHKHRSQTSLSCHEDEPLDNRQSDIQQKESTRLMSFDIKFTKQGFDNAD